MYVKIVVNNTIFSCIRKITEMHTIKLHQVILNLHHTTPGSRQRKLTTCLPCFSTIGNEYSERERENTDKSDR